MLHVIIIIHVHHCHQSANAKAYVGNLLEERAAQVHEVISDLNKHSQPMCHHHTIFSLITNHCTSVQSHQTPHNSQLKFSNTNLDDWKSIKCQMNLTSVITTQVNTFDGTTKYMLNCKLHPPVHVTSTHIHQLLLNSIPESNSTSHYKSTHSHTKSNFLSEQLNLYQKVLQSLVTNKSFPRRVKLFNPISWKIFQWNGNCRET